MSGKPTVATVPPSFTVRLAAIGSGANRPTAFNKARSFAASTFTTLAEINPTFTSNLFYCFTLSSNSVFHTFMSADVTGGLELAGVCELVLTGLAKLSNGVNVLR